VIPGLVLTLLSGLVTATFGALPTSPSLNLTTHMTDIVSTNPFGAVAWLNNYVPIDQALDGIAVILSLLTVMWLIRLVLWIAGKIHLTGSGE